MSRSLLDDAFAHHVWATLRLIDACLPLTREELDTPVPGTYGSILEKTRQLVEADNYYLRELESEPPPQHRSLTDVRLAQAIHHGTDQRSQICTALTTLGLEPPLIDVWAFGVQTGRVVEVPPTSSPR